MNGMKIKIFYYVLTLLLIGLAANGQELENKDASMLLIPAGEFTMGMNQAGADYNPAHRVVIDSFYMDKHEVTNSEYYKFSQETGYKLPETWGTSIFRSGMDFPNHPVIGINWYDANEYAKWAGKRLPTEAEWEYAARGGLIDQPYPNGENWAVERRTNTLGNGWMNLIVDVETFRPNGYGLYDMGGNVWEWTADIYDEAYYSASPEDNPKGPGKGTIKSIRGGSWHSGAMCKRVYFRRGLPGNWVDFAVGFRCAKVSKK